MRGTVVIMIFALYLTIEQSAAQGYSYDRSGIIPQTVNSDTDDIRRISNILHPYSANIDVHKDIFSFSPPDSELKDDILELPNPQLSPKKHFKIIFIRSPDLTQDLTKTVAKLAANKAEQKTVIYVLKKQTDLNDLTHKLQLLKQENPHKPEVYFVKYHNDAEAAEALKSIQSKYESLGGSTRSHGSQMAPLLNIRVDRRKH